MAKIMKKKKKEKINLPDGKAGRPGPVSEQTDGIGPETVSKERPEQGVIVAVGAGRMTDQGKLIPLKVRKGQKIIFSKYGPDEIKIKDKDYFIISESNILAIIE